MKWFVKSDSMKRFLKINSIVFVPYCGPSRVTSLTNYKISGFYGIFVFFAWKERHLLNVG